MCVRAWPAAQAPAEPAKKRRGRPKKDGGASAAAPQSGSAAGEAPGAGGALDMEVRAAGGHGGAGADAAQLMAAVVAARGMAARGTAGRGTAGRGMSARSMAARGMASRGVAASVALSAALTGECSLWPQALAAETAEKDEEGTVTQEPFRAPCQILQTFIFTNLGAGAALHDTHDTHTTRHGSALLDKRWPGQRGMGPPCGCSSAGRQLPKAPAWQPCARGHPYGACSAPVTRLRASLPGHRQTRPQARMGSVFVSPLPQMSRAPLPSSSSLAPWHALPPWTRRRWATS
jgi:hypothetical protein